jgi:6-phosphogluconolactonase (cycloisomerase 2 family)
MVFAPQGKFCFVACELSSEVVACTFDSESGALQPFQVLSTVPDGTADNSAAGIVLDASVSRLYVSNRGHDSVTVFSVDAATGRLAAEGWTGTGGRTPRFIALAPNGHGVIAANEDSDTIARLMPIEPTAIDAMAQPTSFLAHTGSPVCVVFNKEPS